MSRPLNLGVTYLGDDRCRFQVWAPLALKVEVHILGDYMPICAEGDRKDQVGAFARRQGSPWAVIAAPRLLTGITRIGIPPLRRRAWGDDPLRLPEGAPQRWRNVYTGEELRAPRPPEEFLFHKSSEGSLSHSGGNDRRRA